MSGGKGVSSAALQGTPSHPAGAGFVYSQRRPNVFEGAGLIITFGALLLWRVHPTRNAGHPHGRSEYRAAAGPGLLLATLGLCLLASRSIASGTYLSSCPPGERLCKLCTGMHRSLCPHMLAAACLRLPAVCRCFPAYCITGWLHHCAMQVTGHARLWGSKLPGQAPAPIAQQTTRQPSTACSMAGLGMPTLVTSWHIPCALRCLQQCCSRGRHSPPSSNNILETHLRSLGCQPLNTTLLTSSSSVVARSCHGSAGTMQGLHIAHQTACPCNPNQAIPIFLHLLAALMHGHQSRLACLHQLSSLCTPQASNSLPRRRSALHGTGGQPQTHACSWFTVACVAPSPPPIRSTISGWISQSSMTRPCCWEGMCCRWWCPRM